MPTMLDLSDGLGMLVYDIYRRNDQQYRIDTGNSFRSPKWRELPESTRVIWRRTATDLLKALDSELA